jgi:hypothetical protein
MGVLHNHEFNDIARHHADKRNTSKVSRIKVGIISSSLLIM